ncbi:MAG TPA: nuclear transport factor 2 family protein [Candidatus Acidoferrum sp.]|nr:nuclear transport factor 2 family protein [Candidatus Acidoferrum sp.]
MKTSLRRYLWLCSLLAAVGMQSAFAADKPADNQQLLDRLQIQELQARYALAHDLTDPALYAGVFTEDGELVSGGKTLVKGREAMKTMTANDRKRLNPGAVDGQRSFGSMRHIVTNSVIDITGNDTAKGICYVTTVANRKDHGPEIFNVGRYEDQYRKVNGQWLIARREIFSDMNNDALGRELGLGK